MTRNIRWPLTIIVTLFALFGLWGFASLGIWQVHRLHWKLDLIQRVDERVHADPVPAPGPGDWPDVTTESAEYLRVTLKGSFLNQDELQVYTPSDYGPSYWVMTPLKRDDGTLVWINRGLVPEKLRDPATRTPPEGEVTVTGLLRISQSKGWLFSQKDDPAAGKWYRRDIAAMSAAKGLDNAAPYFVDEDAVAGPEWPKGGQTVIAFRNSHLSYAITWFAMVGLVLICYGIFLFSELRRRD
ncbi:SURF1 family protein [Pseudooceanicola sp. CBS1P-1]|uniref:SURF1-like protein n=1 Tax=Pseudooceanicola albus TaxID=2692189 RepID=A0A6L7G3J0_9RHOB|nr:MULTISPECIES: SURF1 family protein [Pseudooceanicola]MBT9385000.1 SURF1 family protein [Pseudooceanicola endophyticus]MXN18006.1 SURF1 family protein [Pseudooceanicola albus]